MGEAVEAWKITFGAYLDNRIWDKARYSALVSITATSEQDKRMRQLRYGTSCSRSILTTMLGTLMKCGRGWCRLGMSIFCSEGHDGSYQLP